MREITVIKCGGQSTIAPNAICADIAELYRRDQATIVVHGGSHDIERLAARLGVPSRRLVAPDGVSARYTDAAMLEVITLALAGAVKPRLTTALVSAGISAIGLTGLDCGLLRARRKAVHRSVRDGHRLVVRDIHSGRVNRVNAELLHTLLAGGMVPVISPPVLAEDGRAVNTDADRVAAAVAAAVGAAKLVLLTGAPGVLSDPADESSVLAVCPVPVSSAPPFTGGGMGLKLIAARDALIAGVPEVLIADGRRPSRPVLAALAGAATHITLMRSDDRTGTVGVNS